MKWCVVTQQSCSNYKEMYQKSVMHVQKCFFVYRSCLFVSFCFVVVVAVVVFWRSSCRRRYYRLHRTNPSPQWGSSCTGWISSPVTQLVFHVGWSAWQLRLLFIADRFESEEGCFLRSISAVPRVPSLILPVRAQFLKQRLVIDQSPTKWVDTLRPRGAFWR